MKKNNISVIIDCYGCATCTAICPQNIIQLSQNQNGFYQPQIINIDSCINCGLCIKVCSYVETITVSNKSIEAYATWSKNIDIRNKASSGGTGYEIARSLLSDGYKIIGVRYNPIEHNAEHFIAKSESELNQTIGSKYIQSYSEKAFKLITKGQKYLITGTPCQISSLRKYIKVKKMEDNIVLMDFFCHGVPSKLVFQKYLSELEPITGKATHVSWRDKQTGWHDSWVMKVEGQNNSYTKRRSQGDIFYKFFLGDFCFNKACYKNCKFKNLSSAADIRIGDLWGTKYANNEKGVTGVLAFTPKGKEVLKKCNIEIIPESVETITELQLKKHINKPYYYNFVMFLLRTPLKLKIIYRIIQCLRIGTILKYKLHL